MEMHRLVERDPGGSLVSPLRISEPVPVVLALLFPWLDNQTPMVQGPQRARL
jgi:hypothetical protein